MRWLPVVLWAALILMAANDELSARRTGSWLDELFGRPVAYSLNVAIRKLAHVTVYGILGALTWRADRRWLVVIGVSLLVASTDEWLQSRTLTRSGSPWDVLLDVTAAALVLVILQRRSRRFV
jgi:VanZ family protein